MMRKLKRKVEKLEARVKIRVVPQPDRVQVIKGTLEEREPEAKKRRAELVQKYGPEALNEVIFVHIIPQGFPDGEQWYR